MPIPKIQISNKPPLWEVLLNRIIACSAIAMFLLGAVESLFSSTYTLIFGILFLALLISNLHLEKRDTFWKVLPGYIASCALYLLIILVFFGLGSGVTILLSNINPLSNNLTYLADGITLILVLSVAVFVYLKVRKSVSTIPDAQNVGIAKTLGFDIGSLSLRNVGLGLLMFSMILCMELLLTLISTITNVAVNSNVQSAFAGAPLLFYIFASIIEPINEEIVFRGFLVPRIGILPTSMLLGLAHYSYGSTFGIEVLAAFAFGILAGYVRKRTGSLYPGIVGHILINSLAALSILSFS